MTKAEHAHCHTQALAYTLEDAGFQLGKLSLGKVRDLVTAGKLHTVDHGGRIAIPHAELERYIAEQLGETP